DRVQDRPLAEIGGKGLWTKELDRALLGGKVDFNVHSMKDVESDRPDEIHIASMRPRGDFRERLIGAESLDALRQGAIVGTSSPRRAAQLRARRPDLEIVPLRGNVETRLAKVQSGAIDATLLTSAALKRLGLPDVGVAVPVEILLPAPGQAALGMECRSDDHVTQSMLTTINDQITFSAVMAERAFTRALGATCYSPVAALAILDDGELGMRAQLFSPDGSEMIQDKARFDCGDDDVPESLARRMLEAAPPAIRSLFAGA
ncbi:MAG: hydroxymethylbilane synthase, partial [Sphingomonas sp.]|nr:hydroxymethylbilane synthase [Sphingomonas sp.]